MPDLSSPTVDERTMISVPILDSSRNTCRDDFVKVLQTACPTVTWVIPENEQYRPTIPGG
jgi:hypothetical protein